MQSTIPSKVLLALLLMTPTDADASRTNAPSAQRIKPTQKLKISSPYVVTGYTHGRALPIGKYTPKRPRVFGKQHRGTVCPDPGIIRRVIRKHLVRIRRCYKKHALARDPKRSGRVVVVFTIGMAGKVRAVRVRRSGLADKPTERCLIKVLGRMRFPKLYGIVHVTYPLLFKPR